MSDKARKFCFITFRIIFSSGIISIVMGTIFAACSLKWESVLSLGIRLTFWGALLMLIGIIFALFFVFLCPKIDDLLTVISLEEDKKYKFMTDQKIILEPIKKK